MHDELGEFVQIARLRAGEACRHGRELVPGIAVVRGYFGIITVPHYEDRVLMIFFSDHGVSAFADGPPSPHRYADGSLCMWFPGDPFNRRWSIDDGLVNLLYLVRNHLFREAYWREHGEWLGDERAHDSKEAA